MKPIDLFSAMDCIPEEYVHEAAAYHQERRSHRPFRFLLIAAIIVTMATTAYGVVMRNLHWTPEEQKVLTEYNKGTALGAVAADWYIDDVDITLSIAQPETSALTISVKTWSQEAAGILETDSEYWIEKWNGTSYEELPTLSGKPWYVPKQTLACNDDVHWTADYGPSYGQLEAGHYRLGMMVTLTDPHGTSSQKGCYAKFRVYTLDVKPYVDAYVKAFQNLVSGDTYHISIKQQNLLDDFSKDLYSITDLWKAGQDHLLHDVTYSLKDDRYLSDYGYIMRKAQKNHLRWGSGQAAAIPKSVESAPYVTLENFSLYLDEFDYFSRGVDSVTVDGPEIILVKDPETIVQKVYDEEDNVVQLSGQELHIRYDAQGELQELTLVRSEYTVNVKILSDTADKIREQINAIDLDTPAFFSYAQEMEALEHLAYEKKTLDFRNAAPLLSPNRDSILARAKQECSRNDYNVDSVSYDTDADMWKVEFGISWDSYIYEAVYLDGTGVPKMAAIRPIPGFGEELLPKPREWTQ